METIKENKVLTNYFDENEKKIDLTPPPQEKPKTPEEYYLDDTLQILKSKDRTLENYTRAIERCDLELKLIREIGNDKHKPYRLKIISEKAEVVKKMVELKKVAKFYQELVNHLQHKN